MTTTLNFQRARKPQEREIRRDAILMAAAELFDAEGPQGAGLNAIAAKAGFTKSNVYRYFESREEVLLNLFLREMEEVVAGFEAGVAAIATGDIDALAHLAAEGFIARPRFSSLLSIVSSVLEQNVSEEKIVGLKRSIAALNLRIATAIASRLPNVAIEDCAWVASTTATLVAGMWPNVAPSSTAARVLAMPEFQHLKPVPRRDLARAIRALLASLPGAPSRG